MAEQETLKKFFPGKPVINICGYCQSEYPSVDRQVKIKREAGTLNFSHSACKRHATAQLRTAGISPEQIEASFAKRTSAMPPDLKEHPTLVKAYSRGIFTPQELESWKQQSTSPQSPTTTTATMKEDASLKLRDIIKSSKVS